MSKSCFLFYAFTHTTKKNHTHKSKHTHTLYTYNKRKTPCQFNETPLTSSKSLTAGNNDVEG